MTKLLEIKKSSGANQCDQCKQDDQFDIYIQYCGRCEKYITQDSMIIAKPRLRVEADNIGELEEKVRQLKTHEILCNGMIDDLASKIVESARMSGRLDAHSHFESMSEQGLRMHLKMLYEITRYNRASNQIDHIRRNVKEKESQLAFTLSAVFSMIMFLLSIIAALVQNAGLADIIAKSIFTLFFTCAFLPLFFFKAFKNAGQYIMQINSHLKDVDLSLSRDTSFLELYQKAGLKDPDFQSSFPFEKLQSKILELTKK